MDNDCYNKPGKVGTDGTTKASTSDDIQQKFSDAQRDGKEG